MDAAQVDAQVVLREASLDRVARHGDAVTDVWPERRQGRHRIARRRVGPRACVAYHSAKRGAARKVPRQRYELSYFRPARTYMYTFQ